MCSEIEAQDEKSAVQVVVESDKKRTELMAQSARMTANIEKGTSIEASLEKLRLVRLLSTYSYCTVFTRTVHYSYSELALATR